MKRPTYDIDRLAEDMAVKGWRAAELARRAGVSKMTTSRVFAGAPSAPTMAKLAGALGYSVRRYLLSARRAA